MWGFRKRGGGEPAEYPADWIDCGPIIWSGSLVFTLKTRAGGGEKKRKQRRHPGCQSAINWIAFQAKLWGWSMARKRLSARLRLLLGCVSVCAYENESWHERLFCLAAAQWCKPLETASLFFFVFSGSASSRLRTLAETLDKPGRLYSPCYEPATSLYPLSNQWRKEEG